MLDLLKNYIDQDLAFEFALPCYNQNIILLSFINSLLDYVQVKKINFIKNYSKAH